MTTSILKTTLSHSCGISEEVVEATERPPEEAKSQIVRNITRTSYAVTEPYLASTVIPSPFSLAPPGVATRLTSKFVYDCPIHSHRRRVIKRPMRVSSHSANAINLNFFQEQFASAASGGKLETPDTGSVFSGRRDSKVESETSDDTIRVQHDAHQKGIDFCSAIEKAIVKEINKVRLKPRSYLIELANRRHELIGSTMWTRRSGAIRLSEGSPAIEEAMNALRSLHENSVKSRPTQGGEPVIQPCGTLPREHPPYDERGSENVIDETIESLSSENDSEYVRGSTSDDEDVGKDIPEVELGHTNPSFLHARRKKEMLELSRKGLSVLNVSTGLCLAARDHASDIGPKGLTTHRGTVDESSVRERVERYGVWLESCYEMLSFGVVDAVDLVCQLLIDDGIPDRHHRSLLLSNRFGDMGVHVAPHAVFGVVVVIVVAGRFLTLKKSVLKQLKASQKHLSSSLSTISPLEENVAVCPGCRSPVPRNQCVYGPWGDAYHRHCLRCHQCFSTLQSAFYLYDFDLMAPYVPNVDEGLIASTRQSSDTPSSSASALRVVVFSARASGSAQDVEPPSSPSSAGPTTKPKEDIAPLCPSCYNRLCTDRCVTCNAPCAFPNPLKADKMVSFQINQSSACEECFLNEAVTMHAVSRNLKKVRR